MMNNNNNNQQNQQHLPKDESSLRNITKQLLFWKMISSLFWLFFAVMANMILWQIFTLDIGKKKKKQKAKKKKIISLIFEA